MSRSRCKGIAISLGLVIGLLAICFVFRDRLIAPRLARLFQAMLHQELGLQVAIGRLGGSLLSDIEIVDLYTLSPGTRGPVSALTAKRLHVHYSPCALLKGMAGFVDAMHIVAEGLRAELDLGRGDASSPATAPSPPLPLVLPAVHVRDAAVAIRWGELRIGLDGIRLDAEKDAADARRIRLSAAEWSCSHPRLAAGKTTVTAELALTPESIGLHENQGSSLSEIGDSIERFQQMALGDRDLSRTMQLALRASLIRRFFTDDLEYVHRAKRYFEVDDFYPLVQRVISPPGSHGKLGGKRSGLFLAWQIARKSPEYFAALGEIKMPRTFYLTSDTLLDFIEFNNLEDVYERKYLELDQIRREYPHIVQVFKNSTFSPQIVKGLSLALDEFEARPLIVRT